MNRQEQSLAFWEACRPGEPPEYDLPPCGEPGLTCDKCIWGERCMDSTVREEVDEDEVF